MEFDFANLSKIANRNHVFGKWWINYSNLDEKQKEIYEDDGSCIVLGCAGSGKSILAVYKFLKLAQKDNNYKLVVYTKALKSFLSDGLNAIISSVRGDEFYKIDALLKNIVNIDSMRNSDISDKRNYLIIDEIQDMYKKDFRVLINNSKYHYCFGDFEQSLYKGRLSESDIDEFNKCKLNHCYRLPMTIANFAQYIVSNNLKDNCSIKKNEHKPYLIKCELNNSNKYEYYLNEIDCIVNLIINNNYKDVGIFVNDNESVREIYKLVKKLINKKYAKNDNNKPEIGYKYKSYNNLKFKSLNTINIMTLHSCKGTEFENVFIVKCDKRSIRNTNSLNYRQALYVGCTRTTRDLFITYSEELCEFIPYEKKELYNRSIYKDGVLYNDNNGWVIN